MPKKNLPESEKVSSRQPNKPSKAEGSKRKRQENTNSSDTSSEIGNFQDQMNSILQEFSCNMTKSVHSKQEKVVKEIKEAAEISSDEMLNIFNTHKAERQIYLDEFRIKLTEFFEREADNLNAEKEKKVQFEKKLKYEDKQLVEFIMEKEHHLQTAKNVLDVFYKGKENLDQAHTDKYFAMHNGMNEELEELKKKIQVENQEQAMAKLRTNLQNLLP